MKSYISIFFLALFFSCSMESKDNMVELDLMSHGVPITIKAPENAVVKKTDMLFQKELQISGDGSFNMIITMDDAITADATKVKTGKLKSIKEHRFFFRIVQDDESGFIYENRIDSLNNSFGFNYIRIQGDKEIIFENSRIGMYSLEEVQNMYSAVTKEK